MCGIIAALAYGGNLEGAVTEAHRQAAMRFFNTELLQHTMARGKDATGVSTLFSNGYFMGLKMGVSSVEFITRYGSKETDYEGYLNIWSEKGKESPATITIGHCRKPSTGTVATTDDNNNNHPIKVGNIIGVHNGTLTNHETIFKNLKCARDGKVDSEAIFRILHYLTENGKSPFTKDIIKETCARLSGTYAVMAYNALNPYQLAAFRDGRPMELAIIKPLKLVLIASEQEFLKSAVLDYNKQAVLYQGRNGMPALRKADVIIDKLADDSMFLFDLTRDINADTKVEDLFVTEKVSRTDKTWKDTTITTGANTYLYGGHGHRNPHQPTTYAGSTSKTCTSGSQGSTPDNKRIGMAWSYESAEYVPVYRLNDAVKAGNVVINCTNNVTVPLSAEIVDGKSEENKQFSILDKSHYPLDDMQSNRTDIKEHTFTSDVKDDTVVKKTVVDMDSYKCKDRKVFEEDTNSGPFESNDSLAETMGMETATLNNLPPFSMVNLMTKLFFQRGLIKDNWLFSNNIELSEKIDIDLHTMQVIPLYTVANKFVDNLKEEGRMVGTDKVPNEAKSIEEEVNYPKTVLAKYRKKVDNSSGIIRTMKGLLYTLTALCPSNISEDQLKSAVESTEKSGFQLKKEDIGKIVKMGDLRKNDTLSKVINIMEKEKR